MLDRARRKRVLNSSVLRVELAGKVCIGDHAVVRGEVVAIEAEGAHPVLGGEVDASKGVKGCRAFATEWGVREGRDILVRADRSDGGGERDHALTRLHLRPRPNVPSHPHSVHPLRIGGRHLRHDHSLADLADLRCRLQPRSPH